MADQNGLSPGDTGYDYSSDPYWGIAYGGNTAGVPVQSNNPASYYVSPNKGQGDGKPYDPNDPTTWITGTPATPNTVVPNTPPPAAAAPPPVNGGTIQTPHGPISAADAAQIDAYLQAAQSTDDKNYWYDLVAQHGGTVATVGPEWLQDRINRGDGALAVRNGTVQRFQDGAPSTGANGGILDGYPGSVPDGWKAPAPFKDFTLPTADDVRKYDPSYDFDLSRGVGALTNSAAAKGVVRGGGTLQDILSLGTNFADQQYGNVVNRQLASYGANAGTYQTNTANSKAAYDSARQSALDKYGIWNDNRNASLDQLDKLYGVGAGAAGSA